MFDGNVWTWVSGTNELNHPGKYGKKGEPKDDNIPPSRAYSVGYIDEKDNIYIFGGSSKSDDKQVVLNDLWKFDGSKWTWIGGEDKPNSPGIYGSMGVISEDNIPGARKEAVGWRDSNDRFWLFGGFGYNKQSDKPTSGYLNDLWRFDGRAWVWVGGSDELFEPGVYGDKGKEAKENVPGARHHGVSWIDSEDYLWLFGMYFLFW